MTLANIKVGDIVHVDRKGRRFFARVDEVAHGVVTIYPLCRESYRTCTAREVIGHYRKAAGSA